MEEVSAGAHPRLAGWLGCPERPRQLPLTALAISKVAVHAQRSPKITVLILCHFCCPSDGSLLVRVFECGMERVFRHRN